MGLFRGWREPKPDPIGDLCRLLVGRSWEWEPVDDDEDSNVVRHPSGVTVRWINNEYRSYGKFGPEVWLTIGRETVALSHADADRVAAAVVDCAVARASRKPRPFSEAAKLLAKAVLAGEREAARALADEVFEHAEESR
jgi:hypothetical protein